MAELALQAPFIEQMDWALLVSAFERRGALVAASMCAAVTGNLPPSFAAGPSSKEIAMLLESCECNSFLLAQKVTDLVYAHVDCTQRYFCLWDTPDNLPYYKHLVEYLLQRNCTVKLVAALISAGRLVQAATITEGAL